MLNKKTWEISLLKFENAEIFYITPKNQLWAIFNTGLKKCIKKSLTDVKKLPNFFEKKNFITYKDSKKIKKGIKFKIFVNGVNIYFKTKKIHIEFLNKQNIIKDKKFQELSKFFFSTAKQLDQFYTTPENAFLCSQIYNKIVKINKCKDIIIEPSAGCGAFINSVNELCNNVVLIDIDPKHESIEKSDFLKFDKNLGKFNKVHLIGNPPFNIINKFIKQASKIAHIIGFILPLTFRKESYQKKFPLNFHCIHEHVLSANDYNFCGFKRKVPTIFQIWEKRNYNRNPVIRLVSKNIEFVKKSENPVLAFTRVGSKSGQISDIIYNKSESSHYFIKFKNGFNMFNFIKVYKKIKFCHNNTVGQKSISQQELLFELKKHYV